MGHPRMMAVARVVFAARRGWCRVRYPGLSMGKGVMIIGRLRLRNGTKVHLGDHVRIRRTVRITGGGSVTIGARSRLNGTWIVASENVEIGEGCLVADCGITDTDFHNLPPEDRHKDPTELTRNPVSIGRNAWIGLGALVLKGSRIGDNSVVGAGAVVRGAVDPEVVVTGNPARVVKRF